MGEGGWQKCENCFLKFCQGAIQIIRDTLGGRGGGSKNVTQQFSLVITLIKFDKNCRHMGGGGGLKSAEKVSRFI